MPNSHELEDNAENIQNIQGGQGMQVNKPTAPVIQAGPNSTINVNYGESPQRAATPRAAGASLGKRQRLEAERERLNQNWQTTNEKLAKLETASAIESAAAQKFQLEKQIETTRTELLAIETRLDEIEEALADP